MNIKEQARLDAAVRQLRMAQNELETLGFHGVADHVRFCANDVALKADRLNAAPISVQFKKGCFVVAGDANE